MTEITITRWRKYGHDRAYLSSGEGTKLGHVDLRSGEYVLEPGTNGGAVEAAVLAWCAEHDIPPPVDSSEDATEPEPEVPTVAELATASAGRDEPELTTAAAAAPVETAAPDWTDLASNQPGEGVRMMAEAEWAAAKDRSKVFATLNRYVFDNHTNERAWRKGAEGEEFVGAKLNKLRERGWHVLHSVPVGKGDSDIDHVAIGPGGVFTINSKNHASKKIWVAKHQMRVNGQPFPYLRNAQHEASRAKKLLEAQLDFEVPVMGCVVVLTGSFIPDVTYKQMPDDVRVLDKLDVPRWFKKRPSALSPEQVNAVFEVARRSTTWSSRA